MRNFNIACLLLLAGAAMISSCSRTARIEGTLAEVPESDIVVRLLDVNRYKVLDTLKTDASGKYRYNVKIEAGQPEFIYLFYKDTKIASLLLQKGDKVVVSSDTLGTYSVTGSEETRKLMEIEKDESDFNNEFSSISARIADLNPDSQEAVKAKKELTSLYVSYYRKMVKYILQNSHSLTCIPVLYQTFGNGAPVFGQPTDAIHFQNICDSLSTVYPDSKYVAALREEAARRQNIMKLNARIQNASESAFPELELPDVNGRKVKLSSLKSHVVMLYFWNSSDAAQKMFNQDVMKPVYNEYHQKGFDIYSVSVDQDKALWATVVKSQELPWTNVSDVSGSAVSVYNVTSLPYVFFIVDGALVNAPDVKDAASLRRFLASRL